MMDTDRDKPAMAEDPATLERHIMDPCVAKSAAEWWAAREIEKLRTALAGVIKHWREFGEMIVFNNAVNRDDYGFDERIEDAAKLVPDRVAQADQ